MHSQKSIDCDAQYASMDTHVQATTVTTTAAAVATPLAAAFIASPGVGIGGSGSGKGISFPGPFPPVPLGQNLPGPTVLSDSPRGSVRSIGLLLTYAKKFKPPLRRMGSSETKRPSRGS